jgi:Protein of unknown function (DUF1501)
MAQPASRRGFLSWAALTGGALVLPTGLLTSIGGGLATGCQTSAKDRRTPHYFVFYLMVGGWDIMLSTDPVPRKDGFWIPYDDDELVTTDEMTFGPAMKPLLPYANRMAILRGIYVDALNHPQARFRMVTGQFKPPGNVIHAPSVQTLIAQKLGDRYEMPNLSCDVLRPASFRGDIADPRLEPVRVASVDQLKGLVRMKGELGKYRRDVEEALRQKDAMTTAMLGGSALAKGYEDFSRLAKDVTQSDYPSRANGASNMVDDIVGKIDKAGVQAALAIEAIRQDLAPVVTVGTGEFDSHTKSEYGSHRGAMERGFKNIGTIARGLDATLLDDGTTLLDRTTIVVTSEFSRTPSKNELGGKHHWPTNTMLFLGKGVRRSASGSPYIFGAVDDNLVAVAVNPNNGSTKKGAEELDMNHGLATTLAIAGIDPMAAIKQEPITSLLG